MQVKMTFYGFPDNDPPGRAIAFPHSSDPRTLHEEAGGVGTFEDPITTAAATGGAFSPGTRLYVPDLKKYLIIEDMCASCEPDQIDVWMESTGDCPSDQVLECENTWTPDDPIEVEVEPGPGRALDMKPFFNIQNCDCAK
ncbi:hypothetical protein [Corallococcus sp. 4LFB]|uniref:hypothetical protein n=1 Tax=Corallococcus sp. 4LFB TaxID=3383249 RepID=UPI003974FEC3